MISPPDLAEFDRGLAAFEAAATDLSATLARGNEVRPLVRARHEVAVMDVVAAATFYREAYVTAAQHAGSLGPRKLWDSARPLEPKLVEEIATRAHGDRLAMVRELARLAAPGREEEFIATFEQAFSTGDIQRPIVHRLQLAYKAMFYFLRVHQDSIYLVLFNLVGERTARGSMESAENPRNPVGELLRVKASKYLVWFRTWRQLRNEVKEGRDFSIVDNQLGITFVTHREIEGHVAIGASTDTLRVQDMAIALEMAQSVVALAGQECRRARRVDQ